ncbi:hypothetical protein P7H12_21355 [Paenibacillus larvae]|nr:hypothetical protein [Paenibacillus larvae]MDT2265609.1 hypothetical protein [Paenibacillus larvae]
MENKKDRLAKEGKPKTKINNLTKLDVIFDDVLAEIYISIVKEMAIQYNVKADASNKAAFKGGEKDAQGNNQKSKRNNHQLV